MELDTLSIYYPLYSKHYDCSKYYNSILYHINACYEPGTDEAIRTSLPVSLPLPAYW